MPTGKRALVVVLLLGAALRFIGLGWGLPRYDAALASATPVRSSFHPDEDKILRQLSQMHPEALDFHPRDFGWGTLHTYLVGAALAAGRLLGLVEHPLRGFREARPEEFPRVFLIGRAVSALFGVSTLILAFLLARRAAGERAGLLAALILAVSPLHVVHGHFLTADVALAFWIALAVLLLDRGAPTGAGFVAGLALATKPSAAFLLPVFPWLQLRRRAARGWAAYPAAAAGFLLGQPYALLAPGDWTAALLHLVQHDTASAGAAPTLALRHLYQLSVYGLGPVAIVLAFLGLRRAGTAVLWAAVLLLASLPLSRHPLARYTLPVLPLLAVAAGVRLATWPPGRARVVVGGLAVLPALAFSVAQVGLLTAPHTAQQAADWIDGQVPEGSSIVQLWPEYPILDGRRYRVAPFDDPFGFEGRPYRPLAADVVIRDDLPLQPFRPELEQDLQLHYERAVEFQRLPRLGPLSLPEPAAPHDWKYTHPRLWVHRRR